MNPENKLSDQELIDELRGRFDLNRKALQDLTALTRKLEDVNKKLQDSEALKSHFLSNIRNEIINPLTSIMGLSRQLIDRNPDPVKTAETASLIHSEAFQLDFQLRNIFMAAELEAGETIPEYVRVDIDGLVTSTIDLFSSHAQQKSISVVQTNESPLHFCTDAQKLEVILHNLLANAIEFTSHGGTIEVEASLDNDTLCITVHDTGCGIAEKDRQAIFDRFRQLEMGTTKSHRGHGLGLSVTGALNELLGGTLDLESYPGKGSAFSLRLPSAPQEGMTDTSAPDGNFFLFEDAESF